MAKRNQEKPSVLRRNQVEKRTGLSRSTIYLYIQEGTFPKPIHLGSRAVGWLEHEVSEWLEVRIKDRDSAEHELT
jgi:prophage regulatory protein